MAPKADALLVVGAPNSSNSKRLVEVGRRAGCAYAQLVQRATDIDWRALDGIGSVGITAGATLTDRIDLFVDARNLFDKKAVGDISAAITATPASAIFYPVERRAVFGGVRARF